MANLRIFSILQTFCIVSNSVNGIHSWDFWNFPCSRFRLSDASRLCPCLGSFLNHFRFVRFSLHRLIANWRWRNFGQLNFDVGFVESLFDGISPSCWGETPSRFGLGFSWSISSDLPPNIINPSVCNSSVPIDSKARRAELADWCSISPSSCFKDVAILA